MSIDPSTSGTLDFKQASKVTFVGSSSNTVIDTVTGSFGIGVDVNGPSSNLHVVGNTRLEGDINMLHTSNNAAIKLNSNVVTEFPRSKKLIKYPRVALTGSTSGGYTASASVDDSVNDRVAWKAFNSVYPRSLSTDFWYSGASGNYNGGTTGREYDGSTNLGSDSGRTATDSGEWLQINLPNKIQLTEFKVWGQPNTINNHPAGGVLYARNTINEDWTELHVFDETRISVSNTNYTHELSITPSYYNTYALVIKKVSQSNPGTTGVSVGELELFGLPEYDPDADGVDVKVTSYPNIPNTDWLEVYYDAKDLADGAVTSVDDLTPSGTNDGTATNVTVSDGAFVFNGTNSNVTTGTTLSDGAYPHSVSLWYYTNDDPSALADYLFQLGDNTENNSPSININGATFYLSFYGNYLYNPVASTGIQAKKWVQISYSYDGGPTTANNPAVYIDGKQITMYGPLGNSAGSALSLVLGTDPNVHLTIGSRRNGTLPVNGKIANFRLFNRALTQDEVWQLYAYQKEYFGHGDLGMTLKAGRLGIGTSEPRAALEVMGDIVASSPVYFYLGIDDDSHVAATTKIPFHLIRANKGGGYDTETYNFTAPIGGWYWMAFGGNNRSASSVLHMSLKDGPNSSDTTLLMAYDRPSGQSLMHAHRSGLVYIREGGIVSLWVTSSTVDAGNGFGGASVEWGGFLVSREFQGEN